VKILCVNYEYPPVGGGGAAAARGLAESLVRRGHQIDCVTSHLRGLPEYEFLNGVRIHRVRCLRRERHYTGTFELATQVYPSYRKALTLARSGQYDFNHTHFIIPSGLTSYLLWRRTGLPYVITAHGSDVPGYNPDRFSLAHKLIQPVWRRIVANAALIISPSHFLKRLIQQHIDVPVEVVANGAQLPELRSRTVKRNQILVVARMFERKGVQFFLEAIRDLKTDWDILIAGDGPYLPTLKAQAETINPKVQFLGFLGRQELDRLYEETKIFVFPSIQENFPVVLLEAMNAGCAIITTTADGCAEVVGDTGVTTPVRQPGEIRQALDRLMANEQLIENLGARAMERVKQFSWDNIASQYETAFQRAVGTVAAPVLTL
jgi:glycosyltransferase involved in cell wall biosynthesis